MYINNSNLYTDNLIILSPFRDDFELNKIIFAVVVGII